MFTTDCNRFVIIPRHESMIQSFLLIATDVDTKCRVLKLRSCSIVDCSVQTNFNYKSRDENFIIQVYFLLKYYRTKWCQEPISVPRFEFDTKFQIWYKKNINLYRLPILVQRESVVLSPNPPLLQGAAVPIVR